MDIRILPVVFGPADERHGGMADGARAPEGANSAMGVQDAMGITRPNRLRPGVVRLGPGYVCPGTDALVPVAGETTLADAQEAVNLAKSNAVRADLAWTLERSQVQQCNEDLDKRVHVIESLVSLQGFSTRNAAQAL
ncbi:MAG TPA: hypothetical protein PK156_26905 [Polyangium sp.]|nr:hypothetical protein [Polyangium sp.]